jgi:small-conductance mechanosensitive channel
VYVGRGLILVLLACLAPLALAAYALPQTDDLARLWWRAFTALLFVQVLQAALVAVAVGLVGATDWLASSGSALASGLLVVVVLYLLFRLPFAAYHWALQVPVARNVSLHAAVAAIRGTAV